MPSYVWITLWVVAIAAVALLHARERRTSRRAQVLPDRLQHQAVRDASLAAETRGANGVSQTWLG